MTSGEQFKELIRAPDGIVQQEHKQHSVVLLRAQEENNNVGSGLELAKIHQIIMDYICIALSEAFKALHTETIIHSHHIYTGGAKLHV